MLTGASDFQRIDTLMKGHSSRVRVLPFLEDIGHAYSVADVAVARAGASSVFELAAFGIPTVYVPYPYAADDHQRKNVEHLVKTGGAIVIDNHALSGEALEAMRLCASDPLCSEHSSEKDRSLHAAACHACSFVSETSCEKGNRYLDRALVVPTLDVTDAAFFG